jgi:hypothetical protein
VGLAHIGRPVGRRRWERPGPADSPSARVPSSAGCHRRPAEHGKRPAGR